MKTGQKIKKETEAEKLITLKACRITLIILTLCLFVLAMLDLFVSEDPDYIPEVLVAAQALILTCTKKYISEKQTEENKTKKQADIT